MRSERSALTKVVALTVTFNHEWLDDIMSNHLKVGMPDPVTDSSLGTGEEVIDDGYFVTQEHQTVNEVRSNKTSAAGNQDTLALRSRQERNGWETRQRGIRDRMSVWMKDGLGLIGCKPLGELGVQFSLLCILLREIGVARGSQDIMRAEVERSQKINGDFTIEAKIIGTNGLDFSTRLVQHFNLVRSECVRKTQAGAINYESWLATVDRQTNAATIYRSKTRRSRELDLPTRRPSSTKKTSKGGV